MIRLGSDNEHKRIWIRDQLKGLQYMTMVAAEREEGDLPDASDGFGLIFEVLGECLEVLESMK